MEWVGAVKVCNARFPTPARSSIGRLARKASRRNRRRQPKEGILRDEVLAVLSTQATVGDMSLNSLARRLAVTPRTISELLDEQT